MKGKSDKSQALGRRDFLTGAAAVAMVCGSSRAIADMPPKRFEMTVINPEVVSGGCGLCVIMRTPAGKTYLFDAANGNDRKSNGKDIIVPWLEKRGISRIDGLILSHYHSDHFGGLPGKLYNQVSQIGKERFRGGEQRQKGRKTGNGRGGKSEGRNAPMGAPRTKPTKASRSVV